MHYCFLFMKRFNWLPCAGEEINMCLPGYRKSMLPAEMSDKNTGFIDSSCASLWFNFCTISFPHIYTPTHPLLKWRGVRINGGNVLIYILRVYAIYRTASEYLWKYRPKLQQMCPSWMQTPDNCIVAVFAMLFGSSLSGHSDMWVFLGMHQTLQVRREWQEDNKSCSWLP